MASRLRKPSTGRSWACRSSARSRAVTFSFFQVGEGNVLLAFLAEVTLKGDQLPPHGATGPGHFALGIEAEAFNAWRKLLHGHGVTIEKVVEWPRGGKSLYFRDPAGNSVELVTPGVWGLPSGW
jgi:catechol 2,3-dioxygenase-like lactoylglutathione lyase family enzyme